MPIYPVTNNRTGKSYEMPWDKPGEPSTTDVLQYIDSIEHPSLTKQLGDLTSAGVDKASRFASGLFDPVRGMYNTVNEAGKKGAQHIKEGNYPAAFHDVTAPITDPFTKPGELAGQALNPDKPKEESKPMTGGQMVEGGLGMFAPIGEMKKAYQGGDYSRLAGQVVGTGAMLNAHKIGGAIKNAALPPIETLHPWTPDIAPEPFGPQPDTRMSEVQPPLPRVRQETIPPSRRLGPVQPPPPEPPPAPPQLGLPPKGRTFFGGPAGGSLSEDIDAAPGRVFAGGQGSAPPGRTPARSFSAAQGNLRPSSPMYDATPNPIRDILEQNSPYRKLLSEAPSEPPSASPQFSQPAQGRPAPKPAPKLQNLKGGDVVPGSNGKTLLDTRRPYKLWRQETLDMGYPADEIDIAKKVADHFGEDITRSDDLHDFNTYMEGAHGQDYIDHVDKLMGSDSSADLNRGPKTASMPAAAPKPTNRFAKLSNEDVDYFARSGDKDAIGELNSRGLKQSVTDPKKMSLGGNLNDKAKIIAENVGKEAETTPAIDDRTFVQKFVDRIKKAAKDETGSIQFGPSEHADLAAANKIKAKDWATRRDSATHHGQFAWEDFKDLFDQPDLMDKYKAGDRKGRLADVQEHLDKLDDAEVEAGISNYRHGSTLDDHTNLADYVATKTRESKTAIANKDFDTYLDETDQKAPHMSVTDPGRLRFSGAMSKQLGRYTNNVFQDSPEGLSKAAQLVSKTKNIYLAGGVPGTPLNIHGWNTARSRYMASGTKGLGDFAAGVFRPSKDIAYLKSERGLIQKAIDYGYQMTSENDDPSLLAKSLAKSKVGRGANKVFDVEQKLFEDPLFKVSLPANKARVLRENYDRLLPKVGEEEALRQASTIANDFMGGINKSLRNKTYKDLLQIGVLAPDWAESRINLAVKGAKALAGKEDPIYAKALGRGGVMRGVGAAAQLGLDERRGKKPSDMTTVGLGMTSSGKIREAPIYGTAVEALRMPEEAIRGAMTGDFSPVTRIIRNRASQPIQSGINMFYTGEDSFGNPLSGKDKYNRHIPLGQAVMNYANEATAPLQPQQLQSLVGYMRGKQGGEEALAQAFEAPVKYSTPQKKGSRKGAIGKLGR